MSDDLPPSQPPTGPDEHAAQPQSVAPGEVRCAQCGQLVPPGASACPACGKLVAVPVVTKTTTPVVVGVLGGFGLGLVIAIGLVITVLGTANLIATPTTHWLGSAIIILTAIVLPAAIFLAGLRLATGGKPALGAFLMVGVAIGSVLACPCTIAGVFSVFSHY